MVIEWIFLAEVIAVNIILLVAARTLIKINQNQTQSLQSDPYHYAKQIIEKGGDVDQIKRYCQISHSEAILIKALHKNAMSEI